jgi:opacity protein-like surface antigen
MKRLSAVAVALFLCVSSSQAAWDMFAVTEEGTVEAKIFSGGKINLRFSPMENLEIFSTNQISYLQGSSYAVGARYQIMPSMLSAFLDIGIPDAVFGPHADTPVGLGLVPGVQFSMDFTDQFSLGLLVGVGLDLNYPTGVSATLEPEYGVMAHLGVELELGYSFNDNFGAFLGTGFEYDRLNQENREDLEMKDALSPYFGIYYSVGNLTVSTSLGIELNAVSKDVVPEESIGVTGGVDLTIKF